MVVFDLAGELYGVDIFDVREIVGDTPVTRIPGHINPCVGRSNAHLNGHLPRKCFLRF
ncbi:chemotaxis protein CheW [Thermacetogenium phaeum]|uniref:chemotaxis protein CheW n=1 Tax=Thermacetogenium phaeum TaxID=85874 RepID=UPI0009DAF3FA|nr:chemotaxis protein CheW [Thermacetogenium phaeum]